MANEDLDLADILLEGSRLSEDDGDLFQEGEGFVVGEHVGDFEGLTRSRPLLD